MRVKLTSQPLALMLRRWSRQKIIDCGGRIAGPNVVFIESDAGFDDVVKLFGVQFPPDPPIGAQLEEKMLVLGPPLWAEFHVATLKMPPAEFAQWLQRKFRRMVPCGKCRRELDALVKESPPPQNDELFAWGVEIHNAINAKLNTPDRPKRQWTIEEAKEVWTKLVR